VALAKGRHKKNQFSWGGGKKTKIAQLGKYSMEVSDRRPTRKGRRGSVLRRFNNKLSTAREYTRAKSGPVKGGRFREGGRETFWGDRLASVRGSNAEKAFRGEKGCDKGKVGEGWNRHPRRSATPLVVSGP